MCLAILPLLLLIVAVTVSAAAGVTVPAAGALRHKSYSGVLYKCLSLR